MSEVDMYFWKTSQETKHVITQIQDEIKTKESELLEDGGIKRSSYIDREYCYSIGYMDGLKMLLKLIDEDKDE